MLTTSQQPIGHWAVVSLTIAIVVLLVAGAISIAGTASSAGLFRANILASTITHDLDNLEALVLAEEAAQRGFLISGRESYLQPYETAERQLAAGMTQIELALSDKPDDTRILGDIQLALNRKRAEIAATLETYRTQSPEAALASLKTDQGSVLMSELHKSLDALRTINTVRRDATRDKLFEQLAYTNLVVIAASFISLLGGIVGVWFVRRGLQSQQTTQLMRLKKSAPKRPTTTRPSFSPISATKSAHR